MSEVKTQTVSEKIIDKFLNSLAEEEGFKETATRLRKTILENKIISEDSIREALFKESET